MLLKHKNKGFTLVELMIVVGIVAVLSSLATQNVIRSRMFAAENTAINVLVLLRNSCISYYSAQTPNAFPSSLVDLTIPNSNPPYLNPFIINSIIDPVKGHRGYKYTYAPLADNRGFYIVARPAVYLRTGERSFLADRHGRLFTTAEDRAPNTLDHPL